MSDHSDSTTPNTPPSTSRRDFLGRLAVIGAAGFGGSTLLAACGGDAAEPAAGGGEYPVVEASTCQGYDALDEGALNARQALSYADESSQQGQYCGNCRFKQAYEQDSSCVGCQLFAGPVSPAGWCQSWAAMA